MSIISILTYIMRSNRSLFFFLFYFCYVKPLPAIHFVSEMKKRITPASFEYLFLRPLKSTSNGGGEKVNLF